MSSRLEILEIIIVRDITLVTYRRGWGELRSSRIDSINYSNHECTPLSPDLGLTRSWRKLYTGDMSAVYQKITLN